MKVLAFAGKKYRCSIFENALYYTVLLRGLRQKHDSVGSNEDSWMFLCHKTMYFCMLCLEINKAGKARSKGENAVHPVRFTMPG